jgi:NAD(P)H-flavin reductase
MADRPRECRARVTGRRQLALEIIEIDLQMLDPPELAFSAGQWVSVPFGPKTVRAYSIASAPRSPSRVTLCADVAPNGIGSRWFRALAAGDEVGFKGPLGGFVWSADDSRRPVFVAEEIGIVPIRSILTDFTTMGLDRPTTLVYWARDPGWLAYDDEFRSLARRHSWFAYHPVVGQGGAGWAGLVGTPAGIVDRLAPNVAGLVAYVAGGEDTITKVRDVLMAKGLDRRAVKWEKFW